MTTPEILSLASSLMGIIFSPLGAWFAYRSYKKGQQAVDGSAELARRLTNRTLYRPDGTVKIDTE